jgi:hypothetical protein
MFCEIKFGKRTYRSARFMDHCTVIVQPAGEAGERQVFLTLSSCADATEAIQQIELVIPERAANYIGDALVSGSIGIMRKFDL